MVSKLKIFFLFTCTCHLSFAQPDYSKLTNWAAHPFKKDCSDSIPAPLKNTFANDTIADIFFIHPTSYLDPLKPFGQNAPVDNEALNFKTDKSSILYQASIFNKAGRVFAPRYRQAHISSYFPITEKDTLIAIQSFDTAYADVKQAFEFYLTYYNNGRPIIIASHSQGTTHAKRLLKDFFDNTPLQPKLIVAYLVGMPVEYKYFNTLKPCSTPQQTNCYCSWRTFKNGYLPDYISNEKDSVIVSNPLTWDTNKPKATRFDNKGSILKNFNKIVTSCVDANVAGNVLWTIKPRFFGNIFLTTKNYHIADYNFYYLSIQENALLRIKYYLTTAIR